MQHARYGGSTIKRVYECPAWVEFCEPLPKSPSSEFADRGTLLHNAMDLIYRSDAGFDPRSVIGSAYEAQTLDADLYDEKILAAIEAVEAIFDRYDVQEDGFLCETRVVINDEIWGTSDLLATGRIWIDDDAAPIGGSVGGEFGYWAKVGICLDYKFGDGHIVKAFENDQGLFYSVAAARTDETARFFEEIDILVIGIIQPNERGEEDYTLWECDPALLETTREKILNAVAVAKEHDPRFKSGDHCNFCPGRGLCPATSGEISAMRRIDVTAPDLIKNIPTFDELKQCEGTIAAIRKLVHSQIEEGVPIPGFKLVPKRATRAYSDEAAVREIVKRSRKIRREEAYTDKLKSPTQLEKLCKAKKLDFAALFGAFVHKKSSGTTLAGEDDPRDAAPSMGALQALIDRD